MEGKTMVGTDLISQILDLDRRAEERINDAIAQSEEKKAECARRQEEIEQSVAEKVSVYSEQLRASTDKSIEAETLKIRTQQKGKLKELDAVYEREHERWEQEIFNAVVDPDNVVDPRELVDPKKE